MAYILVLHKMIKTLHTLIIVAGLVFAEQVASADNILIMDQQGNDVIIDVLQAGYDNSILVDLGLTSGDKDNTFEVSQNGHNNDVTTSISGESNSLLFYQQGNNNKISWVPYWGSQKAYGGDIDGNYNNLHYEQQCSYASCQQSYIGQHIQGNSNNVRWGQGVKLDNSADTSFYYDGMEEGGKTAIIDIHGDSNSLVGWQASSGAGTHSATVYLYSDSNSAYIEQRGNGNKTLNLTMYNDSNAVGIVQQDNAAHTAAITLQGLYSTSLDLLQQGTTAQSYTLFQDCQTIGGCSVSITQD